jgi:hypothetical protein
MEHMNPLVVGVHAVVDKRGADSEHSDNDADDGQNNKKKDHSLPPNIPITAKANRPRSSAKMVLRTPAQNGLMYILVALPK